MMFLRIIFLSAFLLAIFSNCGGEGTSPEEVKKLVVAISRNNLPEVKALIEDEKISPGAKDKNGRTALHWASVYGHLHIVKYLVEQRKVKPDITDDDGSLPLHYAAAKGRLPIVKYFVEEKKVNPNTKNEMDRTPLHYATSNGHLTVVKYFIEEKNADARVKNKDGHTAYDLARLQKKYWEKEKTLSNSKRAKIMYNRCKAVANYLAKQSKKSKEEFDILR